MCELAVDAIGAFIDDTKTVAPAFVRCLDNGWTKLIFVPVHVRVTAQPSAVHLHVSHTTKLVIVVISFRTPGGSKFARFFGSHLTQHVDFASRSIRGIDRNNGNSHVAPDERSAGGFFPKKDAPLLRSKLQV